MTFIRRRQPSTGWANYTCSKFSQKANDFYHQQRSCGEVMFLHLSVSHSVHGGAMRGGGAMHGGKACMAGGAFMAGGRAWQERRPLQRAVRILLECILFF